MIQALKRKIRNYNYKVLILRASEVIYSDRFVDSVTIDVNNLSKEVSRSDDWRKNYLAQWALRLVARHEPESVIYYRSAMEHGYQELHSFEETVKAFQKSAVSDVEELITLFASSASAKTEFELECIHTYLSMGKEEYLSDNYSFEAARYQAEWRYKER